MLLFLLQLYGNAWYFWIINQEEFSTEFAPLPNLNIKRPHWCILMGWLLKVHPIPHSWFLHSAGVQHTPVPRLVDAETKSLQCLAMALCPASKNIAEKFCTISLPSKLCTSGSWNSTITSGSLLSLVPLTSAIVHQFQPLQICGTCASPTLVCFL